MASSCFTTVGMGLVVRLGMEYVAGEGGIFCLGSDFMAYPLRSLRISFVISENTPSASCYHEVLGLIENRMLRTKTRHRLVLIIVSVKMKNSNQDLMDQPAYNVPKPRPLKPPWLYATFNIAKIQQDSIQNNQKITAVMANTLSYSESGAQPHTKNQTQRGPFLDFNLLFPEPEYHQSEATSPKQFLALDEISSIQLGRLDNFLAEQPPLTLHSSHVSVSGCKRGIDNITHLLESQIGSKRQKIYSSPLDIHPQAPEANWSGPQDDKGSNQGNPQPSPFRKSETHGHSGPDLFPCPFYRHDPIKCRTGKRNTCIGTKWTIHRLKEHIYRRHHSSSHRCSRCFEAFDTDTLLYEHQRAKSPCLTQPDRPEIENIDDLQKSQIRRNMRGESEVEKWEEIYRIIFRLGTSDKIPSPQFDIELGDGTGSSLDDFGKYLISQLQPNVDQGAESEIRACLRLLQSFKQSRSMTSPTTPGDKLKAFESPPSATEREQDWANVDTLTVNGQEYGMVDECMTSIKLTGDIDVFPNAGLFYTTEDTLPENETSFVSK